MGEGCLRRGLRSKGGQGGRFDASIARMAIFLAKSTSHSETKQNQAPSNQILSGVYGDPVDALLGPKAAKLSP